MLRDIVAHLDSYAVGDGWRQTGQGCRRSTRSTGDVTRGVTAVGTILDLGGEQPNLRAAANAAIDLARVVERVRAKHPERVGEEANAALRRQYGITPE